MVLIQMLTQNFCAPIKENRKKYRIWGLLRRNHMSSPNRNTWFTPYVRKMFWATICISTMRQPNKIIFPILHHFFIVYFQCTCTFTVRKAAKKLFILVVPLTPSLLVARPLKEITILRLPWEKLIYELLCPSLTQQRPFVFLISFKIKVHINFFVKFRKISIY